MPQHRPEINIKNRITQDDQHGIICQCVPGNVDRMPKTQRLFLFDKSHPKSGIGRADVLLIFSLICPTTMRRLGDPFGDDLVENVPENRLTGNIQEHFGKRERVRTEPLSRFPQQVLLRASIRRPVRRKSLNSTQLPQISKNRAISPAHS